MASRCTACVMQPLITCRYAVRHGRVKKRQFLCRRWLLSRYRHILDSIARADAARSREHGRHGEYLQSMQGGFADNLTASDHDPVIRATVSETVCSASARSLSHEVAGSHSNHSGGAERRCSAWPRAAAATLGRLQDHKMRESESCGQASSGWPPPFGREFHRAGASHRMARHGTAWHCMAWHCLPWIRPAGVRARVQIEGIVVVLQIGMYLYRLQSPGPLASYSGRVCFLYLLYE